MHRDERVLHDLLGRAVVAHEQHARAGPAAASARRTAARRRRRRPSVQPAGTGSLGDRPAVALRIAWTVTLVPRAAPSRGLHSRVREHGTRCERMDRRWPADADCLFCKIVAGDDPRRRRGADRRRGGLPRHQPAGADPRAGRAARPLRRRRRAGRRASPDDPRRAGRLAARRGAAPMVWTTTAWSSTPAPARVRLSSTPTCTCSAEGR